MSEILWTVKIVWTLRFLCFINTKPPGVCTKPISQKQSQVLGFLNLFYFILRISFYSILFHFILALFYFIFLFYLTLFFQLYISKRDTQIWLLSECWRLLSKDFLSLDVPHVFASLTKNHIILLSHFTWWGKIATVFNRDIHLPRILEDLKSLDIHFQQSESGHICEYLLLLSWKNKIKQNKTKQNKIT